MAAPHNVDQLRNDIDHGRTGDKVDYPDPAAVPLGTDAEAAGHPPGPEEVAAARETPRVRSSRPAGSTGGTIYVALAVLVAVLIVTVVVTAS